MTKNPQTCKHHYFGDYDHKARWLSYYYQIREIKKGERVLEIGIGNGTVADYLKKRNQITTLDIDKELNPDIVGTVLNLPFRDKEFDVVLCAEVLEHLPFEDFEKSLKEIRRVGKRAIISLPDCNRTLVNFILKLPFIIQLNMFIKIPSFKKHKFDRMHYWEIGKRGYPISKIKRIMQGAGFGVERHFVPRDVPTKHYFVLT